jgi:hypothetical protein
MVYLECVIIHTFHLLFNTSLKGLWELYNKTEVLIKRLLMRVRTFT